MQKIVKEKKYMTDRIQGRVSTKSPEPVTPYSSNISHFKWPQKKESAIEVGSLFHRPQPNISQNVKKKKNKIKFINPPFVGPPLRSSVIKAKKKFIGLSFEF